ncbi:MAG TPA: histidine kinase [Mesorhizobium sp.]
MSVFLRLFATIGLIFLLSSAGGALIGYFDARMRMETELRAAMAVGKSSADRAVTALANSFRPADHLTEFVSLFDGDRHLQAKLIGANGGIIFQSKLLPPEENVPAWFVRLLEPAPVVEEFKLPGYLSNYAHLVIETNGRNEIDDIWSGALVAAVTLLLFMGLVLSLVALVVWHALRPVKPLLTAFEKFGTAEESAELTPVGPPEFRQLYAGFNAMAARLKTTERRNAALSAQIATIQEEERAELARDLHDDVGPLLFAIDVDAAAIRAIAGEKKMAKAEAMKETSARAQAISRSAVTIKQLVRAILARLRPNLAADIGLEQALIDLVAGEQERHPGVKFEEQLDGDCHEPLASAALYAVAREAIHNALHHARPQRVSLSLRTVAPGNLELAVENDGGGLKPARPGSHGLRNMRERIEALGGRFAIEELNDAAGVRVRAALPTGLSALKEHAA